MNKKNISNTEQFNIKLLEFIVCPKDQSELKYSKDNNTLKCKRCHKVYKIIDGIPDMT